MDPQSEKIPLVITLGLDEKSFARLQELRNRYYPPRRNQVPAHLTLFHQVPEIPEVWEILRRTSRKHSRFPLHFTELRPYPQGMAVKVHSPDLRPLHRDLQRRLGQWLIPRDKQRLRPHVTLMNRVNVAEAAIALSQLKVGWQSWEGTGESVLVWRYLGGSWDPVAALQLREP